MAIIVTTKPLIPVRRDGQLSSFTGAVGGSTFPSGSGEAMSAAEILVALLTVDGAGSGLDADKLDGYEASYFLAASTYTAADILAKLLTVDGADSGLDADLLDGHHASDFITSVSPTFTGTTTCESLIVQDLSDGYIPYQVAATDKLGDSPFYTDGTNIGVGFTSPLAKMAINGGLHVGGESDPGDNNILVDGTTTLTGVATFGDDLGTSSFSSGFSGSGWKLDKDTDYSLTVDNLTVRKLMRIYELEINKISSVNGGLVISAANGKAYSIDTGSGNIFSSWNNAYPGLPGWTHFTSSGLEITAADNIPGGVGRAASNITSYVAKTGVTITIQGTLTLVTGTNTPAVVIYDHLTGTEITTVALDSGVNNKTYTFLADYDEVYFVFSSRYASDMAISFTNVSITDSIYKIIFDEDNGNKQIQFAIDDYIMAQEWTGRGTDYYLGQVTNVVHNNTLGFAYIAVNNISGTPWIGCDLVQKGNSSDTDRQSAIYITSSDDDNPYMDVLAGIDDGDYTGKTKVRLGNLTGITDADFGALSGFGLWSDRVYLNNAYLKGSIYASAGTIGGFTITSSALSCGSAGSAGWGGINSNGTVGLTYLSTYIRSQQSEGGTYTLTLTAPVPRVLALDYPVESTLKLPSSGLPSSGSSTMITIIHAYGTGLGAGKYHIQGNGYYINSGGSRTTSIDLDEGEAITLVWDPRQGGQWYEC